VTVPTPAVSVPTGGVSGPVTVTAGSVASAGAQSAATRIVSGVGSSWVMAVFFGTSVITGILMVWL
jgi:hypothetical protein